MFNLKSIQARHMELIARTHQDMTAILDEFERAAARIVSQDLTITDLMGERSRLREENARLRAALEQFGRRDHLVNCAVRAPVWVDARRGEAIVTACYLCQMFYEEHHQSHPCSCGAAEHNAAIDAVLAEHNDG